MIYDVSVLLGPNTPLYPGDPPFLRTLVSDMASGALTTNSHLNFGAHTGTHIDAPFHMIESGDDVTKFSANQLLGPARLVEIKSERSISLADLEDLEWTGVSKVLFKTKNSDLWKSPDFAPNYIFMEEAAAEFLAEKTSVNLVGVDYLSLECFGSHRFGSHLALMRRKVVIVEGLDFSAVTAGDYLFFCGALALAGADGAPCRAYLVDQDSLAEWR
jgi:arylformamidase